MKYGSSTPGDHGRWKPAVWIRLGYGHAEAIRSAREALEQLSYRWPAERGPHYLAAKVLCLAALDVGEHREAAREAFTKACAEAHLDASGDIGLAPTLRQTTRHLKEEAHGHHTPQV